MKKLKHTQLGAWCDYCLLDRPKNRAVYVSRGFRNKACEEHKDVLSGEEERAAVRDARYTEADDQTWGDL